METSSIAPELNSLLNKLTVEIETDQKEIEIRQKRIKKNEVLLHAVKGSLGVSNTSSRANDYGTKNDTLRSAIQQMTKQRFTSNDIEEEIKRINPEMPINGRWLRTALWTFAKVKHELIKQVVEGNNRQPAEFEKLASQSNGVKMPLRSTPPPSKPTSV